MSGRVPAGRTCVRRPVPAAAVRQSCVTALRSSLEAPSRRPSFHDTQGTVSVSVCCLTGVCLYDPTYRQTRTVRVCLYDPTRTEPWGGSRQALARGGASEGGLTAGKLRTACVADGLPNERVGTEGRGRDLLARALELRYRRCGREKAFGREPPVGLTAVAALH